MSGPYALTSRKNAELHMIIAELPVFSHKWLAGAALGSKVLEPPVGSGPYRLAGFDLGKQSQYQRRDDYWAKDLPVRLFFRNTGASWVRRSRM